MFPFKTNNYVVDALINWNDVPSDPMFILTFPQRGMLSLEHYQKMADALKRGVSKEEVKKIADGIREQLNYHPAREQGHNVPGLNGEALTGIYHKYKHTISFIPQNSQTCHAYCTFCSKWPLVAEMDKRKPATGEIGLLAQYLKEHSEVNEVLFSGGDPLILSAKNLAAYIEPLLKENIPNLQTICIETKALGFWPYRFTNDHDAAELLELFGKIETKGINLVIMAQFNHPVELSTDAARMAIRTVQNAGAQIRTQSQVVKHINDRSEIWAEMWHLQTKLNCTPYYMFIAHDAGMQNYFTVTLDVALHIFQKACQQLSSVCLTVRGPSMYCQQGKVQVLGVSKINGEKVFVMRMLHGRDSNWDARPFLAKYNEEALCMEDLKPAFGEEHFFFERSKTQKV